MANEAKLVQRLEDRLFEVTVADGATIEKGTILKFSSDPNTCTASSADGDLFAGVLAVEKEANDGQTKVPVWRKGVFAMTIEGSSTTVLGEPVKIKGTNLIAAADDDTVAHTSEIVGISLETGGNSEEINVLVGAF